MPITIWLPQSCIRNLSELESGNLSQGECFKIEGYWRLTIRSKILSLENGVKTVIFYT